VSVRYPSIRATWLERPLSGPLCAIGWVVATVVFLGLVRLVGGPTESDLSESAYATWTIAHGHFACAYSPASTFHFPSIALPNTTIAPLWPLLSGGLASLLSIGHSVPFPSQSALGPHCSSALAATFKWSVQSGAATTTVKLGYITWLVLMAGTIALLRAVGRGRCGWEPTALVILACVPFTWMALGQYFHPQDIVAMGLALGCLACAKRGWWIWAGAFVGLAVTAQQFSLLVLLPLAVVAPTGRRLRFVSAALGAVALVIVPMVIVTSGRAVKAEAIGSGNSVSYGGTVLGELHLHGAILVAISRILPLLLSIVLARWSLRRLGPRALDSVPLLSLIATSLSLRLVLEQNLFGYYLMALSVTLVMVDIISGRIRGQLVAWLVLAALAFSPVPWGFLANGVAWGLQEREVLPFIVMASSLCLIVWDARNGQIRRYLVALFVVTVLAFGRLPGSIPEIRHAFPTWFWQLVIVGTGVVLAAGPLLAAVRDDVDGDRDPLTQHGKALTHA
jgi:hypothetical protein